MKWKSLSREVAVWKNGRTCSRLRTTKRFQKPCVPCESSRHVMFVFILIPWCNHLLSKVKSNKIDREIPFYT